MLFGMSDGWDNFKNEENTVIRVKKHGEACLMHYFRVFKEKKIQFKESHAFYPLVHKLPFSHSTVQTALRSTKL